MKNIISITSVLLVTIFSAASMASDIAMMDVRSDVEGDETAHIALRVGEDKTIENVLYQNLPGTPYRVFSISDLNQKKEAIVKKGPVAIVEIGTETITKNSIYFYIHYIYEYKLVGSIRRVKKLKMYYVSPSNQYETLDTDTNKVVRDAFFYVRIVDGKQKGIDRIETW